MIHKDKDAGCYVISCSEQFCTTTLEVYEDDWFAMLDELKSALWRVQKDVHDEFVHFCPEHA